jgi:hypothetical protein
MMATPNMNLTLPVVSQTPGPTWASEINAALTTVDSHDHTSGKGELVPVAGLNIDSDLSLATHALTNVAKVALLDQASVASLRSIYAKSGDLYWRSGGGSEVRLTVGGAIDVSSVGGITGMIPNCSVVYDPSANTYTFRDDSANFATLVSAAIKFGSVGSTLLGGGNFATQFPSALPVAASSPITFGSFVVGTLSSGSSALSYVNAAGGITRPMQAAVGEQIQAGSTSYTAPNTGALTNLSDQISITTTGRPVFLGIRATGTGACLKLTAAGNGPCGAEMYFNITGTSSATVGWSTFDVRGHTGEDFRIPVSSVSYLWTPAAGTYTIQLEGRVLTGGSYVSTTFTANLIQIYAYEL